MKRFISVFLCFLFFFSFFGGSQSVYATSYPEVVMDKYDLYTSQYEYVYMFEKQIAPHDLFIFAFNDEDIPNYVAMRTVQASANEVFSNGTNSLVATSDLGKWSKYNQDTSSWMYEDNYSAQYVAYKRSGSIEYLPVLATHSISSYDTTEIYAPATYSTINVQPGYAVSFTSIITPSEYDFSFFCDDGEFIGTSGIIINSAYLNQYTEVTNLQPDGDFILSDTGDLFKWSLNKTGITRKIISMYGNMTVPFTATGNTFTFYNTYSYDFSTSPSKKNGVVSITYNDELFVSLGSIISDAGGYNVLGVDHLDNISIEDGVYYDEDENPYTPPIGGNVDELPPGTFNPDDVDAATSLGEAINQVLNGIRSMFFETFERLGEFLSLGIQYAQQVGSIFSWLPEPLPSFIIIGILLFLITSVVKFLRG